jgi:aspartate racemase
MKRIGLLGGTSWPSTINYYKILNQLAQDYYGGYHSAKLLLWNIDYHAIKSRYHDGWDEIPALLKKEIINFSHTNPDCLLICNNTLHEAYDIIAEDLSLSFPSFHIVHCVAEEAKEKKLTKLLLLGTKYTMEHGYYYSKLEDHGLDIVIPSESHRKEIQTIQSSIARGNTVNREQKNKFQKILENYTQIEAIVTACTELPLIVTEDITDILILDPTEIQCQKAFKFATS